MYAIRSYYVQNGLSNTIEIKRKVPIIKTGIDKGMLGKLPTNPKKDLYPLKYEKMSLTTLIDKEKYIMYLENCKYF